MAKECEVLGKKKQFGDSRMHRHSQWRFKAQRTKRTWDINTRKVKVQLEDGSTKVITMSMKAYKRYRLEGLPFLRKHGAID